MGAIRREERQLRVKRRFDAATAGFGDVSIEVVEKKHEILLELGPKLNLDQGLNMEYRRTVASQPDTNPSAAGPSKPLVERRREMPGRVRIELALLDTTVVLA